MSTFESAPGLTRLFDRALVLDRRDVARILVEDDGPEHTAHDLAAARLGQHGDEIQLADDRHGAQFAPHRVENLAPQRLRRRVAVLQQHERGDYLATRLVRPADDAAFGDGRVRDHRAFDLDGPEPVRGDLDDLVGTAAEPEVAVVIHVGRIAGVVDARNALPVVARVALRLAP